MGQEGGKKQQGQLGAREGFGEDKMEFGMLMARKGSKIGKLLKIGSDKQCCSAIAFSKIVL